VLDEMANAAFFLGLMTALPEEYGDVTQLMPFDTAKTNFFNAARYGLNSQTIWIDGESRRTGRLVVEELLPRARRGLEAAGIDAADIDRYLGTLEERVRAGMTGSQWVIDSLAGMDPRAKANVRMRTLAAVMKRNQEEGLPLHQWQPAEIPPRPEWIDNYMTVEQFMSTDLFTVRPEDIIDLAASLMHWKRVRHVPVENDKGELVGIISHRDLLELIVLGKANGRCATPVREIMKTDLITITPQTSALDALFIMRERGIGCLPVVNGKMLVGLITAYDYLTVSAKLFEHMLTDCAEELSKAKSNDN
jgi:CBS domain-containing protein